MARLATVDDAVPLQVAPAIAAAAGLVAAAAAVDNASRRTPWRASLRLAYVCRDERTVPVLRSHEGPLRILKGHRQSSHDCWEQIIVHPPGGIAAHDELDIDVSADDSARVLLTTPGATKWYRTANNALDEAPARQTTRISVANGAGVEWLPLENILFDGCNARLETRIDLDETAALLSSELVCLGRPAGDAPFTRGRLQMRTEITRAGRPLFIERIRLAGGDRAFAAPAGLNGQVCFGSLVAVPPSTASADSVRNPVDIRLHDEDQVALLAARLTAALHEARDSGAIGALASDIDKPNRATAGDWGVTTLGPVVIVRWRGGNAEQGWRVLRCAWAELRPAVIGRAAQRPRIWAC